MQKRPRWEALQTLARERAYTVRREGRQVRWWRNEEPDRVYTSFGVGSAIEDILLDSSSKKDGLAGKKVVTGADS